MPPAWSSQLQILTSIFHLEPPSSIHMLDRAVGLFARVHLVSMDLTQKVIEVRFIDGREITIPMNSDCVRMLSSVVAGVKGCSEPESQRDSMEGSACSGSTAGSTEDLPPGGSPTRPSKSGKHKRQRSLLFSLISSLVPKSLSLSSPPPSSAPPPSPLPPLPVAGPVTSPTSSQQTGPASARPDPEIARVRATLVDVWRRYVISALTPQHVPAAGYTEWTLIAMASEIRTEIQSIETAESHRFGVNGTRASGSRPRRTQTEGRNALDFGDRKDDCELEQRRCRAPSPDILNAEDTDRVVYPRREQGKEVLYLQSLGLVNVVADEWGVRYHHPRSSDEADVFAIEYNGHNDDLLGEHFTLGSDWDNNEQLTLELSRMGRNGTPGMYNVPSSFEDRHLRPADFGFDCDDDDRLADTAFDVSSCPLIPSDVDDDEESNGSQTSLHTLENGEDLPLAPPAQKLQGSTQHATYSAPQPSLASRVNSSRPRSRNASAQYSSAPSTPVQASHPPTPSTSPSSSAHNFDYKDAQVEEFISSRLAYLERICAAIEIVRSRAHEEGWRLVRTTLIGEKNGWLDAETERSLEIKAKRRAWSSGIKISAPYSTPPSALKLWGGNFSTFRSPTRSSGFPFRSMGIPQVNGPIVPTGLSLGAPVRSSPLAMYTWGPDDGQNSTPSKYGILKSIHSTETIKGKRSSRVTFADSVTKLFPVCEDDSEDSLEPVQVNAVDFPQAVPLVAVSAEEPDRGLIEGLTENEGDPFYFAPSRPRSRTTSMYVAPPSSPPSSPVLPIFRCTTPPYYQAAAGGDVSTAVNNEERRLDSSALLLQPLSSLSISSPQSPLSRPPLTSNPPFVPRPRAVSLPTLGSYSSANKTRHTYFDDQDGHCEDLSRVYASPPPEGPLVISATTAPHEQYPRYAHVRSPLPASKKSMNPSILGRTGKEVVFGQAGSEFTVGIEVALGRAEEGHVVW
ncbi:hypothetical protein J3R82DRAFT_8131 [Butyriboletus roseoflavus]|nr:hypothetical protein J3R82DRAFT_8131 [Butyriboletus roseoflavus]